MFEIAGGILLAVIIWKLARFVWSAVEIPVTRAAADAIRSRPDKKAFGAIKKAWNVYVIGWWIMVGITLFLFAIQKAFNVPIFK